MRLNNRKYDVLMVCPSGHKVPDSVRIGRDILVD